jgi:uncharacterized protein YbaR (Trm112 family)
MAIDRKLLEILCCPATRVPVRELDGAGVARLNRAVEAGTLKYENGEPVSEVLEEALITEDGKTVYEIRNSIPIMLIEKGIPAAQVDGM